MSGDDSHEVRDVCETGGHEDLIEIAECGALADSEMSEPVAPGGKGKSNAVAPGAPGGPRVVTLGSVSDVDVDALGSPAIAEW